MTLDLRLSVIEIVNTVQRRMGVTPTTTLNATKHATVLLDLLNQVVDEASDAGDWQELYAETIVSVQSSVGTYTVSTTSNALVKNIYEISFGTDIAPLDVRDIQDMRRLQRLNSFGGPRQFGIVGVDDITGNPRIRVYPIPVTAQVSSRFNIAYYRKPPIYTLSDINTVPDLPAQLLILGLYAKALLEENGGEPTPQYQMAFQEYERMRSESLNRFNADTGTDMYFTPHSEAR
jgi:hypothetical protein